MKKFILLLLAFISATSFCQEFSLCTSVYGADNKPIEGVTIKIKHGKDIFTTAGQPCFKELQSGDTISFSAVGYTQWKYIVHKNARLSIQLSAQSFVPAFYKNSCAKWQIPLCVLRASFQSQGIRPPAIAGIAG